MKIIELLWGDFKVDIINKNFPINYRKDYYDVDPTKYRYEVFSVDRGLIYWVSYVNEPADIADFETNYKDNANRNTTYNGDGVQLQMPKSGEAQVFSDLAIRDTASHNSVIVANAGYRVKTIIISNMLDQTVTLTFQASRDQINWFNVCDSFTVSSGLLTYQTCEAYFPYNRCIAQCLVAPTSGLLNAWCEKMGV